jgi:predicted nucleic acid-binding protein
LLTRSEVDPAANPPVPVRDSKDELILGTALTGQVGCLVTGDKDLLVPADDLRHTRLRGVTVGNFLAILAERERDVVGTAGNEPSDVG